MDDLPANCFLLKGLTGCGATTVAIESKSQIVIAVPNISMIENKVDQHAHLIGVYGGISDSVLMTKFKSLLDSQSLTVMCTYDSLERVIKLVGSIGIRASDLVLVVDEAHRLIADYSFRKVAVQSVLRNYKIFKSYTFVTATPVHQEFNLDELKEVPIVEIEWDPEIVNSYSVKCYELSGKTHVYLANLIKEHLASASEENLYFFINSVKLIAAVVKQLGVLIDKHNMAIVCRDDTDNKQRLSGYTISDYVKSPSKKINFLTSKSFEGTDIYDKNGKIFVVSDEGYRTSFVDVSTQMIQIAGRIRDAEHKIITHICNIRRLISDKSLFPSYDDYKIYVDDRIEKTRKAKTEIEMLAQDSRWRYNTKDLYLHIEDGKVVVDYNLVKLDLLNYKIMYEYKNICMSYDRNKWSYSKEAFIVDDGEQQKDKKKRPFKESWTAYCDLRKKQYFELEELDQLEIIEKYEPLFVKMYKYYRVDDKRLERLQWRRSKIRKEVERYEFKENPDEVMTKYIQRSFIIHKRYSRNVIKKILQDAYSRFNYDVVAKATDIKKYFYVSACYNEDGKSCYDLRGRI